MTVSSASAQTYTGVTPPSLDGGATPVVGDGHAPVRPLQVASTPATRVVTAPVRSLALTGTDVISLVILGGFLVTLGLVITRRTRTRSTS